MNIATSMTSNYSGLRMSLVRLSNTRLLMLAPTAHGLNSSNVVRLMSKGEVSDGNHASAG